MPKIIVHYTSIEYNASDEENEQGKGLGTLVAGVLCRS